MKLVINTGRTVATVLCELGLQEQTLSRWVKSFKARQADGDRVPTEAEQAELLRLRNDNAELRLDWA